MIALDGVFTAAEDGTLTFHRSEPPTDQEIAELLGAVRTRVLRHLAKKDLLDGAHDTDALQDKAPLLASCYATSITYLQTLGSRRARSFRRL